MLTCHQSFLLPYSSPTYYGVCSSGLGSLLPWWYLSSWKIQRRTAQWVMKDYNRCSSVTAMLHELNWPPLQLWRKINRLQMFYKIIYNQAALSIPQRFQTTQHFTRHYHPHHFIIPSARTNSYQNSFYLRTIKEWNMLPSYIIEAANLQSFSSHLIKFIVDN